MKTLIVGCSFCNNLIWDSYAGKIDWKLHPDIRISAAPGSGNESIAARLLYECSLTQYDRVVVLWSGINRIDVSISTQLNASLEYCDFTTDIGRTTWYHSGGITGSWTDTKFRFPNVIRELIKTQYLDFTNEYLSDRTFRSIITVQSFLSTQNISYKMAFAYDIYKHYFQEESYFGQADVNSSM